MEILCGLTTKSCGKRIVNKIHCDLCKTQIYAKMFAFLLFFWLLLAVFAIAMLDYVGW